MKELIDETNFTPDKLFDEKEFNTVIVGKEGLTKKESAKAEWLTILLNKESTREEKDDALKLLKEKEAADFIIKAIQKTKNAEDKATLIAACWETGLDFSAYYTLFAEIIAGGDYLCAIEAYTVLETIESTIDKPVLESALKTLNSAKDQNQLVSDAIGLIQQKLNAE
jgi:hypothetical protein